MKWKLWTRNENIRPPDEGADEYDSEDAALERACGIIRRRWHIKVLRIEGPEGKLIEAEEIAALCKARAGPPGIERGSPGP